MIFDSSIFILQGDVSRSVMINVQDGLETKKFCLYSIGIERKLKILHSSITFPNVIPDSNPVEENFTIQNNNSYPIEIFWHHLDE